MDPRSDEPFQWPPGFVRIPDEAWVREPIEELGASYDRVYAHGWYANLDPTADVLVELLRSGDLLIDYSGGTGILVDRLRQRMPDLPIGMLIVDASAKFLRVAVERHHADPRVAFRLLHYRQPEKRLESLEESLGPAVVSRGAELIASTNAIHLYGDLAGTLASWRAVLRPGGTVSINSGNIRNPAARPGEWIIDETVYAVTDIAKDLVRTEPRYARYGQVLDDDVRMRKHLEFRDRVFLPPRPLDFYVAQLVAAGFRIENVSAKTITADVNEWYEFLRTYHEAVLGWVGGTARIEGRPPTPAALDDRLALIRESLSIAFGSHPSFASCWTYITARR